jgi:hypothetical protein
MEDTASHKVVYKLTHKAGKANFHRIVNSLVPWLGKGPLALKGGWKSAQSVVMFSNY